MLLRCARHRVPFSTSSRAASSVAGIRALDAKSKEDVHLRAIQFVILVLLISGRAAAQKPPADQTGPTAEHAVNSSPPALSLPDKPKPQKVIDKKFIVVMSTLGLSEAMRYSSRTLMLEHAADAGAPWAASRPSHAGLSGKGAAIYAAELFVTYELKKSHDRLPGNKAVRKFWWVYPAAMAGLHFRNAVNNIQTEPPAGCSLPLCQ